MKIIIKLLIINCLLLAGLYNGRAAVIVVDNFDNNTIHAGWQVEGSTFTLSAESMAMRVDYNRTASSWEWDQFHLNLDASWDLYQYQLIFNLKSNVATQMAVKPVYTDGNSDWLTKDIAAGESYQTHTFSVASTQLKVIQTLYIYFDGGSTTPKSGVIMIDDISLQTTTSAMLNQAVADAAVYHQQAAEGQLEGQFASGSKSIFHQSVVQAQQVLDNPQATQQQIDSQLAQLQLAYTIFEASRVRSGKLADLQLANEHASFETQNMYFNLRQIARYNTLFGMQDATGYGVGWTGNNFRSDVEDVCGSLPAVCSWSVKSVASGQGFEDLAQRIGYIYSLGGINTLEWHMDNPYGGDFYWENNPYPDSNVVRSILPGGVNHIAWRNQLDNIALFLNTLKGASGEAIPVIFRPWHEHTGDWFWWGNAHCSIDEYKMLWQFTVNYLVDEKKVINVLFAYSPDRFYTKAKYLQRYPGDNYIDVFGFDDYGDVSSPSGITNLITQLRYLVEMAEQRDKIPALTETGLERITNPTWFTQFMLDPIKNDAVASRIAYQAVWRNASTSHHYAPYPGHSSVPDFLDFFHDPFTIFLNDLPNIYANAKTINAPLALDDLEASVGVMLVSPNPAQDELMIHTSGKSGRLSVFDLRGVCVHHSDIVTAAETTRIRLDGFAPGLYLVSFVTSGQQAYNQKVIIR